MEVLNKKIILNLTFQLLQKILFLNLCLLKLVFLCLRNNVYKLNLL